MKLVVMGLGYIGLPTAVMFAKHGVQVHGVDINEQVVETLQNKALHIEEPGLGDMLVEAIDSGNLTFGTTPVPADGFIIAVPTPVNPDKSANLNYVRSATEMINPFLEKGNLVVLESTSPPGTTLKVLSPILEATGLKVGKDLHVAYSPERVLPGKLLEELVNNNRIVGGVNAESSMKTERIYKIFVKGIVHQTDATTAEMVKLMENTYRDVNIALANELARIAETVGCDIWKAVELANCHPRVNVHSPGPGVGGHCIAVDPWFLVEASPEDATLIKTARSINDGVPEIVAHQIQECIQGIDKPKVALLGLAYKGNIGDARESPSITILQHLNEMGISCSVHDPYVLDKRIDNQCETVEQTVQDADCLVLLTDHNEYKELDFRALAPLMRHALLYDTKNMIDKEKAEIAGFQYEKVGKSQINTNLLHL
ncbi:nucleotide sugar dehydrogenase [Pseudalkalibacillus hwajinpoensis]|uniref:Nucleotide sugar dehydrogenase n=1 Tax=Guptibacillus hwajinpoensis TaxID=208199 RepID=A0A4U1MIV0_9BACL|nr:nucleotide sugar dehydrogenase [Pseudalkalibacillus hwajinpoensis]TKD70973.1 nucleotide sugar dehydrogenase [Pseudalkalibacillus hwajinpoensis]